MRNKPTNASQKAGRHVTCGRHSSASQRALMQAVLQDAILCLRGHAYPVRDRARLAAEAEQWIRSTDRRWPFSFESVCDTLSLDPAYLRQQLLRMVAIPTADSREGDTHRAAPVDNMVRALRRIRLRGNHTTRELR